MSLTVQKKIALGLKSALFYNFYNYEDRASRLEFFSFFIFYWVFLIGLIFILDNLKLDMLFNNIILIVIFALLTLAKLSVSSRRLHDSDLSAYWFAINLIPFVGYLIFLGLMFRPSSEGENRFGIPSYF